MPKPEEMRSDKMRSDKMRSERSIWRRFISRSIRLILGFVFCFLLSLIPILPNATSQEKPILLRQDSPSAPLRPLTPEELAGLQDPLFQLVLKDHGDVKTLAGLVQLLKPEQQAVFVVDEQIVDTAPKRGDRPASRRAIMTFNGTTQTRSLDQNVMLSVDFNSNSFPSSNFIEAMGWDEINGRFNYYKLFKTGAEPAATWKFMGSSDGADRLSLNERQGTCMACHLNGGPVMKELILPWNNWHSFSSEAPYLFKGPKSWPIANVANSPLQHLQGAETLETATIFPTITRFNERRLRQLRSADGKTVTDALRLLKPLFITTEFNLISSSTLSGSHPFSQPKAATQNEVNIPNSFFLNANLISSALNIFEAQNFSNFATLSAREYDSLVQQTKTTLNSQQPGDANFAWFVPEPSFIDTDWVTQLVQREVVPPAFVAAVMGVDLETPILSSDRRKLWSDKILPTQFQTGAKNTLVPQVIQKLEALKPAANTPEARLLQALKSPDPVASLRDRINTYLKREEAAFTNRSTPTRFAELVRLYKLALQRRQAILQTPEFKPLDETGGKLLFPSGDLAANPTPPTLPQPILSLGSRGEAVVRLQQRLKTLGFLSGPADGDFGPGTQAAVIEAQRRFGLTADGVVGPSTWAALEATATPQRPILRLGSQGAAVVELQQMLRSLGVFSGPADGDFGPQTQAAVIAAQKRLGLTADGIVGPSTWTALENRT